MIRLSKVLIAAAATIAVPVSTAIAQDDPVVEGEAGAEATGEATVDATGDGTAPVEAPMDGAVSGGMPPLTLMKGKILITGSTVNIGLFPDNAGKPISLAPSVYYGVSDKLTVGITHDGGTTLWTPRPSLTFSSAMIGGVAVTIPAGSGICVTGEDGFCGEVYNNIGVDALFSIKNEKFSLAAHTGIDVNSFDPFILALRVGVLGRYALNEKMAILFDPRLSIGITERDFNKERIDIPAWFWYMASAKLGVYVHTGIAGPLDGFGDAFFVPLNVGANFAVNEKLTVGGDFAFLNLLGSDGGTDAKMIGLRVAYAL